MHYQNGDDSNPSDIGVEFGYYVYDTDTGTLSFNTVLDNNGEVGPTDSSTNVGGWPTTLGEGSFTINDPIDGPIVLSRVHSASNDVIGAFGLMILQAWTIYSF